MSLHKISHAYSSSSLPNTSSSEPPTKQVEGDIGENGGTFTGNKWQSFTSRRLTRQRKLRYLTDSDVGFSSALEKASSMFASSQVAQKSRSPGQSDHWSSSAVPQPLPLPVIPWTRKLESTGSSFGPSQPTSSQPVTGATWVRKDANFTGLTLAKSSQDVDDQSGRSNGRLPVAYKSAPSSVFVYGNPPTYSLKVSIPPTSLSASDFITQIMPSKSQFMDSLSVKLSIDTVKNGTIDNRKSSQDVDDQSGRSNVRLHGAYKSAPPSALPSRPSSPLRTGNFNSLPLYSEVQQVMNADRSPLHSPTNRNNRRFGLKVQEGSSTPVHQNSLPDTSVKWPEINDRVDAYPLPPPPNSTSPVQCSMQPQCAVNHHHLEGSFGSPMKGQWQKGKLIGRGTFGSVYLATNRKTGASCAMKEVDLIPDDRKSAESVKQLEQEIKVLSRLKHQNIVQYLGSEIVDDHFYIYLEYVHPGSISKFIREHSGAMTESVVRNFTRHVLSGLAYLHAHKTIHRDIKGANLLVDGSGIVKLADFGTAKILNGRSYDLSLKGSPYWMAPEIMKAAMLKDASPDLAYAVDIWSLGCTIIEMFSGKAPWSEYEGPRAMFQVLHNSPPIPETLSTEGQDFLRQCFQRDPARRPSAAILLEHPFVCSLQLENSFVGLHPDTSQLNEIGRSPSPRDSGKQNNDLVSTSRGTQIVNSDESRLQKAEESTVALYCKAPQLEQELKSSPQRGSEYCIPSPHVSSTTVFAFNCKTSPTFEVCN